VRALALILLALAAGGAAHAACDPGLRQVTTAELFFGLAEGRGAMVDEAQWRAFLDKEVTPRFPEGLTVWNTTGQWRNPDGTVVREPAKVMLIVLPGAPDQAARLDAIVTIYTARFPQHSVLLTEHRECARF
jgi:hypothetical protein